MRFYRTFGLLILILAGIAPLAADPAAAAQSHGAVMASLNASDPTEIIKAIYRDAMEGKSDSGGAYILFDKRVRRGVFSKGFLALPAKDLIHRLHEDAVNFTDAKCVNDDVTLLALKAN